ncbi:MAG: phage holin family protein [Chitinophagaceae bacterium]|nr:phage holin family protein [Chitinophagaceae bacterium]
MEKTTHNIEVLFSEAGDFIENKTELIKLRIADKTSEIVSTVVAGIVVAIVGIIFFILLSIGLALWLGEVIGKSYHGFLIVGALYGLIALIIYSFREKWLKTPVSNAILKKIFK